MAWNEPGGSNNRGNNQNPWGQWGGGGGGGGGNQQPPDLDEIIRKLKAKLGSFGGGGGGGGGGIAGLPFGGRGLTVIVAVVIALWLASGLYVVGADEQGVVKRFGAHTVTTEPGLHYHMPWPIETVQTPKVTQIRRIEVGYRERPGDQSSMHIPKEALMLTGDEAIVDLQFAVQYHIRDAENYLFRVADPDGTVRSAAETAIREVVGQRPIDDVLTRERAAVAQDTRELIQEILDRYETGLQLDEIALQSAQAPEPVRPAFRDVISAREDRARAVNEAEAFRNDILPRARGRAERILQEAEGYRAKVVNEAQGSAARFRDVYGEYKNQPEITSKRLYLETMEKVLGNTRKVMMDVPESGNLLYMPLQEMLKGKMAPGGKSQQDQQQGQQPSQGQSRQQSERVQDVRQQFEQRLENIRQGRGNQ
ncbi:FtsH protease activity modulator HflK [Thiohalorhabdus sp.]|uniref:FtsH protease activity modulator HflK n=1 Tax=Thiohalorhabdus sp. TaxID=3094134 RepID=UPI002FC2D9BE